jgi:hypothetical protein
VYNLSIYLSASLCLPLSLYHFLYTVLSICLQVTLSNLMTEQICIAATPWGAIYPTWIFVLFRTTFPAFFVSSFSLYVVFLKYVANLQRLIRRPEHLISWHWYLPVNWRSLIRWSHEQWVSPCYAIEYDRSFYCTLLCVFMTRVSRCPVNLRSEHSERPILRMSSCAIVSSSKTDLVRDKSTGLYQAAVQLIRKHNPTVMEPEIPYLS